MLAKVGDKSVLFELSTRALPANTRDSLTTWTKIVLIHTWVPVCTTPPTARYLPAPRDTRRSEMSGDYVEAEALAVRLRRPRSRAWQANSRESRSRSYDHARTASRPRLWIRGRNVCSTSTAPNLIGVGFASTDRLSFSSRVEYCSGIAAWQNGRIRDLIR